MRYLIAILTLVAVLGTLASVKASQISMLIGAGKAMQKAGPPPEVVSTALAELQNWEGTINAVGTVAASRGVALSNDAPGIVKRLYVDSGAMVQQGQTLVELDSNVERAQLSSIRSRKDLAEVSLRRTRALVESGALAPAQLDNDETALKGLAADVDALEAQIARKVVRAPFSGRLGIRAVNLGQYLSPGTTIAVLESTRTVFVDFTVPQQQLASLANGMRVRIRDVNQKQAIAEGTIAAIEPEVDSVTRSVRVRANMPNPDEKLRPGMFVQVEAILPERQAVLAIPATAVVHATYGDSVFVVESQPSTDSPQTARKTARQQFVRLGTQRGDFIAVLDGVKAGEELVVAGTFKLRNHSAITVNNDRSLVPELSPRPENR